MEYGLKLDVLAHSAFLPITENEWTKVKESRRTILLALDAEERYDLTLSNFVEFEAELLQLSLAGIVFRDTSWSDSHAKLHLLNRRLLNFLSGARLYLDHTRHELSSMFGQESEEFSVIIGTMSEQYDQRFGYRVMEALRNYLQHRGVAVQHFSQQMWWAELDDERRGRHTVVPSLLVTRLAEDAGFKATVLQELQAGNNQVDLRPLVREYVAGIGTVHARFREIFSERLASAELFYTQMIERYSDVNEGETLGLVAVMRDEEGNRVEAVQIFNDLVQRRRWLARKNSRGPHLDKHFVIGETKHRINGG